MDKKYQTFEELTDTATAYLTSLSYNLHMVYLYQLEWRYVGNYMRERGIKEYNAEAGMQYLNETIGNMDYKLLSRSKQGVFGQYPAYRTSLRQGIFGEGN